MRLGCYLWHSLRKKLYVLSCSDFRYPLHYFWVTGSWHLYLLSTCTLRMQHSNHNACLKALLDSQHPIQGVLVQQLQNSLHGLQRVRLCSYKNCFYAVAPQTRPFMELRWQDELTANWHPFQGVASIVIGLLQAFWSSLCAWSMLAKLLFTMSQTGIYTFCWIAARQPCKSGQFTFACNVLTCHMLSSLPVRHAPCSSADLADLFRSTPPNLVPLGYIQVLSTVVSARTGTQHKGTEQRWTTWVNMSLPSMTCGKHWTELETKLTEPGSAAFDLRPADHFVDCPKTSLKYTRHATNSTLDHHAPLCNFPCTQSQYMFQELFPLAQCKQRDSFVCRFLRWAEHRLGIHTLASHVEMLTFKSPTKLTI